ncbi:hypothetical protein BC827DRAFT_1217022 [Russula dissimulans]|nr:hypothetical protein BC827DRAFT_1217022 [Russula dissimulans]
MGACAHALCLALHVFRALIISIILATLFSSASSCSGGLSKTGQVRIWGCPHLFLRTRIGWDSRSQLFRWMWMWFRRHSNGSLYARLHCYEGCRA